MELNHLVTVAAMLAEAIAMVWGAKQLWGLVLQRDMNHELTSQDNPAAALTLAGYFLGVFIALAGVAASPSQGLAQDLIAFALFGAAGVAVLFLSVFVAPLIGGIRLQRDIVEHHNTSAGLVLAATFVATGLIFNGAVRGEGTGVAAWVALLVFQALGQAVLGIVAHLFERITPFNMHREIVEGKNVAAAAGYAGAMVAMGIIVHNAVLGDIATLRADWGAEVRTFLIWCAPLLLLWPVRALLVNGLLLGFRNLDHEISQDRNLGVGVLEAVTYIGFAWLVMAVA
ncbi:MAG: DUF350 domain-containing protein [Candidatus Sericytochromatia bacterium]|nr:DUF350 domain-containing protein [Candidatus Sericytochromatia bacterium]